MTLYLIVGVIFFVVLCRGRKMDAGTPVYARLQHWVPLVLAAASLPVFSTHRHAPELMGVALTVHLVLERRRARWSAQHD